MKAQEVSFLLQKEWIYQSISESLLVLDENGVILDANQSAVIQFDIPLAEFQKLTLFDLFNKKEKGILEKHLVQNRDHGISNYFEMNAILKDGNFQSEIIFRKFGPEHEKMTLASIRDITIRKQSEEALIQAAFQWRRIFDSIISPMFIIDRESRIIRCNRAFSGMVDIKITEMLGQPLFRLIPGLNNVNMLKAIASVLETRKRVIREFSIKNSIFQIIVEPYFDDEDQLIGNLLAMIDITKEKESEQALSETRLKLEEILNSMPTPVFYKNLNGIFEGCNQAFADYKGSPTEKIIGSTYFEFLPRELAEKQNQEDRQLIEEGSRKIYEEKAYYADGSLHDVIVYKSIIKDRGGSKRGLVGTIIDISERKKWEEKIKASLHEKEILLKEIHHRVKNNLYIVSALLNLQKEAAGNPEASEIINESVNRIKSMALIHDKLYSSENLSKIHIGDYITDLSGLLMENYNVHKKIELKFDFKEVYANINFMIPFGLMVNELITNTIKYAFPGNSSGGITMTLLKDSENKLLFEYNDTGVGIPESVNFAHPQTLGLQIIQDLTHQLGGKVNLLKEKGTRIIFWLPLDDN